jgi:hypothetical protein
MKLSVCIPSIPSRIDRLKELIGYLDSQINGREDVEIVVFIDNKRRSIGEKRNAVKNLAIGKYFSIIDDDDNVSDDYIDSLLEVIEQFDVDVITFDSMAHIEEKTGRINMSIFNENQQWTPDETTRRQPFHMCAWKTDMFRHIKFADSMYGEDAPFSENATALAHTEHHIDKILHHYMWDADVTEAFPRETPQQ